MWWASSPQRASSAAWLQPGCKGRTVPQARLASVGVFDSGLGGLSVLEALRRELPHESFLYVADSRNAPYGNKPEDWIVARCRELAHDFARVPIKSWVWACNTATGVAVHTLREVMPGLIGREAFPIVGLEPALKPAVLGTQTGVVGVLATARTLASDKYRRLRERAFSDWAPLNPQARALRVIDQVGAGFVETVEAGAVSGPQVQALVHAAVAPLLAAGADTLVLGCTHYPFLADAIREVIATCAPRQPVALINPAAAVARELRRRLQAADLLAPETGPAPAQCLTVYCSTAPVESSRQIFARLLGYGVDVHLWPDWLDRRQAPGRD
ncbi:glutamate racemase [Amphibiibacter pelophylacis]|uniref:Glutamate racemase n=1 Tax=Amphibiibacter pelophylacis TaxID=1799477 RepID=A0ACC6P4Z9_9BURK